MMKHLVLFFNIHFSTLFVEEPIFPYSVDLVPGEIFIKYADEFFPFLFGREGSFDQKGAYLSMV